MWLHDQLRYQESPYARLVERGGEDPALEEAARRDVETFTLLSELDCDAVLREIGTQAPREFSRVLAICPGGAEDAPLPFRGLRRFIRPTGRRFRRYHAFLWEDGALRPVEQPDCPVRRDDRL